MESEIETAYKKYGYPGINKLYLLLNKKYTQDQIKSVISKEVVYQLHKKPGEKVVRHFVAFSPYQIWQADLVDMSKYAKTNKGNKWILPLIDVFSLHGPN
ncbi:MAG TPA: hypothetical protein VN704_04520 [Verrucomicrobiae bacterium]|nr:hypothetical protein [Verrucomicrobiae bacterium]